MRMCSWGTDSAATLSSASVTKRCWLKHGVTIDSRVTTTFPGYAPGRNELHPREQEGTDHRHHRAGRLVSGRAAAGEGLRGSRGRAALLERLNRSDRTPLPGRAQQESEAVT